MRFVSHVFLSVCLALPSISFAKTSIFANEVQQQALENLNNIYEDSKRMNLKRSSQSMNLTLNQLNTAIHSLHALRNIRVKEKRQYAYRPYAFIQNSFDRKRLINVLTDLSSLHRQYKQALQQNNKARIKQLQKSIHKANFSVFSIRNKWRSKVGKVGIKRYSIKNKFNGKICRNLLPHEKYYSKWESCCDIGKNKSRWLNRASNKVSNWKGSCRSWGLR